MLYVPSVTGSFDYTVNYLFIGSKRINNGNAYKLLSVEVYTNEQGQSTGKKVIELKGITKAEDPL